MSLFTTLTLAIGSSWVSGINLYITVATLGLLGRFAGLELPGELSVLTNWWIIGIALFLFLVEFFADKIPLVDSTWDAIHTFIRIPAGAVLAATAFGDFNMGVQVVAFLLGGGLALSSHGTKAATRAAINTSPEPVTNITASFIEDFIAVGSLLLAVFHPAVFIAFFALVVLGSIIMLPRIIKALRVFFRRIRGKGPPDAAL
jgi:Domain of unknown function (DUF4126)